MGDNKSAADRTPGVLIDKLEISPTAEHGLGQSGLTVIAKGQQHLTALPVPEPRLAAAPDESLPGSRRGSVGPAPRAREAAPPATTPRAIPERWLREGSRPLLMAVDGIALVGAGILLRYPTLETLAFSILVLSFFHVAGLHRSRLNLSVLDDTPRLVGGVLAACGLTALGGTFLGWGGIGSKSLERELPVFAAMAIGLVLVGRTTSYGLIRQLRRHGFIAHRTLVLGAGRIGAQVATDLKSHAEYGLRPIGLLDADPMLPSRVDLPVLGGHGELADVLVDHDVRTVVIAFTSLPESAMVDVIRTCDRMHCEIFIVPRLFELLHVSHDMETLWGTPLVRLRRASYRTRSWQLKRFVDVLFSAVALLVLSPLLALITLAVRLDGGPGVLFKQKRVGVDGRQFTLLKFRSLKPVDDHESATNWNIAHDGRLGRVGRLLRRSSLDELPQLLNILRGDMSVVGPRPERPHFVEQFREGFPRYMARHRVPCGLTGWAQIHGLRGDTSIEDRARFDNYYIENWSPWLDLKIVLWTARSVVSGAGG